MSMTIEQKRAVVAALYTGDAWRAKVAAMRDEQILAIYQRRVLEKGNDSGRGRK